MDIILTGDRPTGKLHLGHYVGSLKRRVEMQNSGKYKDIYIMIADAQALTDNADDINKVRSNIAEVALDYLACGLNPQKSTIYIQSQIPELCELSFYYMETFFLPFFCFDINLLSVRCVETIHFQFVACLVTLVFLMNRNS
jgi:tryptophanyl-tRNA synthetase